MLIIKGYAILIAMAKRINLEKVILLELLGNGLELTLTLQDDNAIAIKVASEAGGQQVGVKQHEDNPNTMVIYLKDDNPKGRFTVI